MKMNLILLAPPVCVCLLCLVNVLKCKLVLLNNVCKTFSCIEEAAALLTYCGYAFIKHAH